MGGTIAGGVKCAATNKRKYGSNYYSRIGKLSHEAWVRNGRKPRGFSLSKERASYYGRIGGNTPKRRKEVT